MLARCRLAATLGVGAALTAVAVPAHAQPVPNCTAADLAGIATGVSAATSAYLFTHPPVNDFFSSLLGLNADEKKAAVTEYMGANPQVASELRGIRAPLVDFRQRCGHLQG
nr:heme-binding protein [Mycolicibacterium iranicum]